MNLGLLSYNLNPNYSSEKYGGDGHIYKNNSEYRSPTPHFIYKNFESILCHAGTSRSMNPPNELDPSSSSQVRCIVLQQGFWSFFFFFESILLTDISL